MANHADYETNAPHVTRGGAFGHPRGAFLRAGCAQVKRNDANIHLSM